MESVQLSRACSLSQRKTKSGTASGKPSSTMAAAKPMIQPMATRVRLPAPVPSVSWKSFASSAASPAPPKSVQSASVAARQKSGMPMTSGKRAAFHGQAVAATIPYPATSMISTESAREAFLCTRRRLSPHLEERIEDHRDGDRDQDQHDWPRQPRRLVARDRDVQVVLGDLAEHQAEHERRPRPAGEDHEVADTAEDQRHCEVAVVVVRGVATDEHQ